MEVNLEDHVFVPAFPSNASADHYDELFNDYLSGMAAEPLRSDRPLWEVHILKYPTKSAASNIVFKLHHSLGDGYSLVGALLSCLSRVDEPSMPLTLPTRRGPDVARRKNVLRRASEVLAGIVHTAYDFGWSLLKSTSLKDDKSPIRSGVDGVEFRPLATATMSFSIDKLKQIKSKLNVVIILLLLLFFI